ncbi:MAG: metallophosphoesterase [Anaerolineales bacterium]
MLRPALESILITTGAIKDKFFIGPYWLKVETIRLRLKRLPRAFAGFRLAQISDIHMGGWMNADRLQHVADLVIAQKPDVLLITGDFLIGDGFTETSKLWLNDLRKG